ncbi:hypothetical protein B6U99_03735 [Candidatus Geothermarchaeota archaeon ex4572_27]|nr:MAG: hypothetical protein B6U99_03735 [Candidatus Geothermarchaeota archaeon ex4572_27]
MSGGRIFRRNGRYYLSFSYLPPRLPHREEELRTLLDSVKPLVEGRVEEYSTPVVYGPTGVGKTTTVRKMIEVLKRLRARVSLTVCLVNCGVEQRPFNVVQRVSQEVLEGSIRGYSYEEAIGMINDALELRDEYLLLVLDEVDELLRVDRGRLLYVISRLDEEARSRRIFPLIVARRYESILDLPQHIRGKIAGPTLYFKPYTREQMRDIVMDRVSMAIAPNAITENAIEAISFIAANVDGGDARSAISLLLNGGNLAEQSGDPAINVEHVRRAYEQRGGLMAVRRLSGLDQLSKAVLSAAAELLGDADSYVIDPERHADELAELASEACRREIGRDEVMACLERLCGSRLVFRDGTLYYLLGISLSTIRSWASRGVPAV